MLSSKAQSDHDLEDTRTEARKIIHALHKAQDKMDDLEVELHNGLGRYLSKCSAPEVNILFFTLSRRITNSRQGKSQRSRTKIMYILIPTNIIIM